MRILVVDDDRAVREPLRRSLTFNGYQVDTAVDGQDALDHIASNRPEALVLDLNMPRIDGLEVCRRLRSAGDDLPILVLTARDAVSDRVSGLDAGADDYLPKPFEPRELVARVQTVLRRFRAASSGGGADSAGVHPEDASVLRFEGLVIDPVRRSVLRHDEEVALTGTEYELLLMLAREPGRVFSRDDILGRLRGHEVDLYSRAVDIVVSRLRRKLEPLVAIKTLRNVGYALALRPQEA